MQDKLPHGWIRDKGNPGLIKLTGKKAEKNNEYMKEIDGLKKRIFSLEETTNELVKIVNKLNK